MEKRRWKRAESSDASMTWGCSSSTNNNRPAMRSILKSSESASAAVVPSSSTACPASLCWSTPRLGTRLRHTNAKAFSPAQRRQHSIDAKLPVTSSTTCRAVTFFLASESSDSSFAADKTEEVKLGDKLPRQHRFCRQNSSSFRRTSLPVQSNFARQNLLLQSQVNSARGILMDLLTANRRDLSPDVAACLKAVTALLNPAASPAAQQMYAAGGCANVGAANAALTLTELGVPSVVESPYSGEVHVALTAKPRVSNITFSTVTSATGLPTIAAEPSRPRSSSYWKPSHAHTIQNHGGHHGGGIATNFSNSLPQRINLYEYEDELHGEQLQYVEQIAPDDMAWKEQQHNEVGDQHNKQQQRRRSQRPVNNNEDGSEPNGQAVQQQQQQQWLLNHNRENNRENTTVEEEEGNQQQQKQREAGTTSSSTPKHPPFTATSSSRRTSAIDDSEQHQQHEGGGGGGASAVVGVGGAVFQQQFSSGIGDNTSLSLVATSTTTTTTATSATTAPCTHHAQSVDSDDMTGQPTNHGFSSTLSHHKSAGDAGTVVGLAKTKSTVDGGGQREKSKSPRGRHSAGREEEESYGSSEQTQPSSAFCTVSSKDGRPHGASGDALTVYKAVNGTTFDRAELERDPALGQIQEWSFPIFRLAEKHKRTVLSRLTYAIFKEADLFRTFKISYTKFFNFFHALESGYWDIPYHNRIHAADVLHGTYYLTCHPVHAFCSYHSSELEDEDELEENEEENNDTTTGRQPLTNHNGQPTTLTTNGGGRHVLRQQQSNTTTGEAQPQQQQQTFDSAGVALPLAQSMSPLELMALYTAAAMHDYDHPGRTNAFLVASEDRKAILYNDRSVLENHHAAESWRLLNSHAQFQFIENLDSAETKRFRYLVLEYILATDLKQHFDIIMQFNERVPDMDLNNESDRVLISLMLIKFADINSPAKPYSLHRQWTERICQEFYEQGDEEKKRKMPLSPYMDRNEPAVAKLQDSFIAHIVNPLAIALNEAGLFPVLPGLPESELIINLKHNHQKWLHQIEAEPHNQQQKEGSVSSAASTVENGADGRHDGAQSNNSSNNNNNFGTGGEAEIVLNNGGVKLPLSNNCSPAASSPSLVAKRKANGKSCGGGDVPSAPRSGGRAVTIAPTPAATTSSSHFVPSGGELRSREGSAEETNGDNAGGSNSARGQQAK
ncbi:hypothetical protein niasHT_008110 [Heterodera trifolii]|uniref:Phosphodiesterase n=1 Tax=Heterodera trifolii TaxID=157864 RepID=A0ABD2LZZ3_9BILA